MASPKVERALSMRKAPNEYGAKDHGVGGGPDAGGNRYQPGGEDPGLMLGFSALALREGGIRGGAVSEPETLPNIHPMGIQLDGRDGMDGMTEDEPDDKGEGLHGMDAGHAKSGVSQGVMVHGAAGARGGHYHCVAEGCDYKTRNKSNMGRHATAKHNMAGGSSEGEGSSNAAGSSMGSGSTTSIGNAGHGMLGGAMAKIRKRYFELGTEGGMNTGEHYLGHPTSDGK